MYCSKCGYKLKVDKYKCDNCGMDNHEIEYCGGYWGIVGESKAPHELTTSIAETEKVDLKVKKKGYLLAKGLFILCILFGLMFSFELNMARHYKSEVTKMTEEVNQMKDSIKNEKELKKENKNLKKENNDLKVEINRLQKENEDFSDRYNQSPFSNFIQ